VLTDKEVFSWDIAERIDFFDPIGMTFLAGLIENQMKISKSGSIKFKPEIINYLERIDFLSYLENEFHNRIRILPDRPEIRRVPIPDRLLEFCKKHFTDTSDVENCILHLSQLCQERIGNAILFKYIDDVFGELLDNVNIHSGAKWFFVIAQRYPQKRLLKISISDLGIGIPAKIRSKFDFIDTDTNTIIYATQSGVTTSGTVLAGIGLTTLKSYIVDPEDYLFIISNNGCVKFTSEHVYPMNNFQSPISGTFVEICFKADSPFRRS